MNTENLIDGGRIYRAPLALILITALIVIPTIACDLGGGQGGSEPMVTIASPTSGAKLAVGQEVAVQASASDPKGIVRLELWANGALAGEVAEQPPQARVAATILWTPGAPGQYTLEVRAISAEQKPTASASLIVMVEQGGGTPPAPTATGAVQPTNTLVIQPTLAPGQPTPPCTPSVTAATDLNVRAGPGTNYQSVGKMAKGSTAQVTGRIADGTWWQIVLGGVQGWVAASYTTPSCVEKVPVVGPPAPPPTPTSVPAPTSTPSAAIDFRADSTKVKSGECTVLHWDVDNVKAVYVGDGKKETGVPGHGSTEVCPHRSTTYVLRVVRLDNQEERRELTVEVKEEPTPSPTTVSRISLSGSWSGGDYLMELQEALGCMKLPCAYGGTFTRVTAGTPEVGDIVEGQFDGKTLSFKVAFRGFVGPATTFSGTVNSSGTKISGKLSGVGTVAFSKQ
jgi:hypothetical protein